MCEKIGKNTYNYLIGFETSQININKLPSYREVLNLFIYKHRSLNITIRNSASSVISDTNAVWANFMIPTIRPQHSIKKLEKFYSEYQLIKKHRNREKKSKVQQKNVENFSQKLDKLFDIANTSAVKNLPKELKQFLVECRNGKVNIHSPVTSTSPQTIYQDQFNMEQEIANGDNENDKNDIGEF